MDLIISLIIVLSPTEYYFKNIPIQEPCQTWFEKNIYYDRKYNNHYIKSGEVTMGYICKERKSGK
jgi:hypothetical protein